MSLYNGRDLDNCDGDPRLWKIERGGVRAGSTEGLDAPLRGNSLPIYKVARYRDFELRLDIRGRRQPLGLDLRRERHP